MRCALASQTRAVCLYAVNAIEMNLLQIIENTLGFVDTIAENEVRRQILLQGKISYNREVTLLLKGTLPCLSKLMSGQTLFDPSAF